MTTPGDWRVRQAIETVASANGLPLDTREDCHFYCSAAEFAAHARGRKSLRMEYFYREQRGRHGVPMLGVNPKQVHAWYLAVYVDTVEWVELPDTLGMSQYADSGVMGSKPYIATGKYIQRMSPHCKRCRYDPAQRSGDDACPFTTLYWNFLMRHEAVLAGSPRMALQVRNVARLIDGQKQAVSQRAAAIRRGEIGADAGVGAEALLAPDGEIAP